MVPNYVVVDINRETLDEALSCANWGVCLACSAIHEGDVEPDASGYHCDECDADEVMGIEQALLVGRLNVTE